MKHTNEVYRNEIHIVKKCTHAVKNVMLFLLCLVFWMQLFPVSYVNAAPLKIQNHVTNDTYEYNGSTVTYLVNGKKIETAHPGIILQNGGAVGPLSEVFLKNYSSKRWCGWSFV